MLKQYVNVKIMCKYDGGALCQLSEKRSPD